jgi:CubicO group peptidase (beta-lactamase class C family)
VPGVDWERVKLESMGYSSARLEALRGWLKTQQTPAMLVAVHGKVDVNQTVKKLGLDDKQPFLPVEEHATLEMPMTARSGIYLPSGNDELDARTPKRGSEYPGTYFSYNNWDFNVLGTAFEKLTGKDIYDALDSELAKPVGMQDFDRAK